MVHTIKGCSTQTIWWISTYHWFLHYNLWHLLQPICCCIPVTSTHASPPPRLLAILRLKITLDLITCTMLENPVVALLKLRLTDIRKSSIVLTVLIWYTDQFSIVCLHGLYQELDTLLLSLLLWTVSATSTNYSIVSPSFTNPTVILWKPILPHQGCFQ